MHAELLNLYLFAYCIFKVLWMTGIGEGLIFVYAASRWQKAFGVPARRKSSVITRVVRSTHFTERSAA